MSDIVRRTSGDITVRGMDPTSDPTKIGWSPITDWTWRTFSDLPESIVASLSAQSLLPSNILLECFPNPDNGVVDAWLIGANGASIFKILQAGSNKWSVVGRFIQFKSPSRLLTDTIASDLSTEAGKAANAAADAAPVQLSPLLSDAQILPASLRRKLIAIKTPTHELSHMFSYDGNVGEFSNYRVDAITVNATQIFALQAKQEIQIYAGESESARHERLKFAPWTVEMIYEKFA